MLRTVSTFVVVALFSQGVSAQVAAQGAANKAGDEYQYPELLVSPSASDRLKDEAKNEERNAWSVNLPMQVSAASTFIAGLVAISDPGKKSDNEKSVSAENKDKIKWAGYTGLIVGGGWLGATSMMAMKYRPYKSGEKEVNKIAGGDKKQQLGRERMAEEALEAPAELQCRLKWVSLVTNLGAAGFMASAAGDTTTKIAAGLAGVMSVTPILFKNSWESTWGYQESYKKKVYGPLTGLGLTPNVATGTIDPVVNLAWHF